MTQEGKKVAVPFVNVHTFLHEYPLGICVKGIYQFMKKSININILRILEQKIKISF